MLQILQIAFRNLGLHRSRNLILGSAIAGVACVLCLTLGLLNAVEEEGFRVGTTLASGHLNIAGFYKVSTSSASPVVQHADTLTTEIQAAVGDDAVLIVNRIKAWGRLISDTASMQIPLYGFNTGNEPFFKDVVRVSRDKTLRGPQGDLDTMAKPGSICLFEEQARKLGVSVGDAITLSAPTSRNIYNTKDLRVGVILEDMGFLSNFGAFIFTEDARSMYQLAPHATGQIMIYLKDIHRMDSLENKLRATLEDNGYTLMEKDHRPFWMKFDKVASEPWTGQRLDITTWKDELAFLDWIVKGLSLVTIVLLCVVLTSIALGIANALWIAVRQRGTELGMMRAIGMQRRGVLVMIVSEALFLSIFSLTAGSVVAFILAEVVNLLSIPLPEGFSAVFIMKTLTISIQASHIVLCFILVALFAAAGAFLPAYRASRISPVEAIQQKE